MLHRQGRNLPLLSIFSSSSSLVANLPYDTDDSWPELLGALFQLSQAAEVEKRENAFRVFKTTPGIIERQHEETVLQAFQKGFKDDAVMVRLTCDYW